MTDKSGPGTDKARHGFDFGDDSAAVIAHDRGRVCTEPRCSTVLSIYNDGEFCSRHEPMVTPRTRGVKIS